MKIAFVTAEAWRELWIDDHPAVFALNERGHIVDAVVWDDPAVDWTMYDAVVLRSSWDYYLKADAFAQWIDARERDGVNLFNPAVTLRWNLDKIYLHELATSGVPIVPTVFAKQGDRISDIAASRGWTDVVLKPRVSAAGHRTVRINDALDTYQAELDDLIGHGGALVQGYQPVIETEGEWSLMFIGGEFSHAARKRPKEGEFRVQFQFGGTAETGKPTPELVRQAEKVVQAVKHPWLYARVDGCVVDGQLLLMELEMLEPSMFFLQDAAAPGRFAGALEAALAFGP